MRQDQAYRGPPCLFSLPTSRALCLAFWSEITALQFVYRRSLHSLVKKIVPDLVYIGCKVAQSSPTFGGRSRGECWSLPALNPARWSLECNPVPLASSCEQPCCSSIPLPGYQCTRHVTIFWVACILMWRRLATLIDHDEGLWSWVSEAA